MVVVTWCFILSVMVFHSICSGGCNLVFHFICSGGNLVFHSICSGGSDLVFYYICSGSINNVMHHSNQQCSVHL